MRRRRGVPAGNLRERLESLADFYNHPDNFGTPGTLFAAPSPPVVSERIKRRRFSARTVDLRFASAYRPVFRDYREIYASYRENHTVYARLLTRGHHRPVIICVHGWGGGVFWLEERAFPVGMLLDAGFDVVLFQLPFHANRSPPAAMFPGSMFPSQNPIRTNEAFGQSIHDLRALAHHLRARLHTEHIGVMGMSLGGYTAALWASVDPSLTFSVPMIPAVSLSELMWRHGANTPDRKRAQASGIDQQLVDRMFAVHAPLSRPSVLPRSHLAIIAGRRDRVTPPEQAEMLWEHWGRPALYWFPGSHVAQLGRGAAFRQVIGQLRRVGVLSMSLAAFGKNQKVSDNDHLETAGKTKLTATVRCDRLGLRTNQANTPNGANRERAGRP